MDDYELVSFFAINVVLEEFPLTTQQEVGGHLSKAKETLPLTRTSIPVGRCRLYFCMLTIQNLEFL